jgi:4a-hydroxytetrahydrobiopterin dehydratase
MEKLYKRKCIPCEGDTPPLTPAEIENYLKDVKGWKVLEYTKIEKTLTFVDFKHALGFVNEVGDLAEFEGHHPDINLHNWNNVTIALSTHSVKGLSENDFIMAAKIDQIIADNPENLK